MAYAEPENNAVMIAGTLVDPSAIATGKVLTYNGTNIAYQTPTTGSAVTITGTITESQVVNLVSDLALKAPIANPVFTGVVTTPAINGNGGTGLTINGNSSSGVTFSSGPIAIADNSPITFGTIAGNQIGTSSTQKIAFYGASPVVRPSGSLLTAIAALGLVSAPTIAESDVTNLVTDLSTISTNITNNTNAIILKAPIASPSFTGITLTLADAQNIVIGTTTGTKIGTSTTQKIGFYGSTAIVQPSGSLLTAIAALGLVATPTLAESDITNLVTDLNTHTTNIALKANTASPTFTGTVTAPTFVGALTGNATGLSANIAESQVTNLVSDLALKAPLSSPTFTTGVTLTDGLNVVVGTVTGTQFGTAATQKIGFYGTTAVVRPSGSLLTAIVALGLISAPTIAEADVTNLVSDLALKSPLASPTFTGTVTAPTFSGALTGNATSITGSITESQVTNLATDLSTHTTNIALKANIAAPSFTGATFTLADAQNIVLGTTTGTQFGTSTTQKIAFFASTPIVKPTGSVITALTNLGLVATPTIAEADVTNLVSDLALKSPLASPTFTGTVTAPTFTGALTGNATSITGTITESQVVSLVSDLALKSPLASPSFTGTVTAINIIDTGTYTAGAAGFDKPVSITPTYNQTSTAKATDLFINRTETAVGSGTQLLIDAQVAGTSKFSVARTGALTVAAGGATFRGDSVIYGTNTNTSNQYPFSVFDSVGNPLLILNSYGTNNNTLNIGGQTLLQMFNSQAKFANGCSIVAFNAPTQFCDPSFTVAFAKSTGTDIPVQITPTYTQTATAGATDFLITRTETSIGSGTQLLIDAQVGGVSKFSLDRNGTLVTNGLDHTSTVQITANQLYSGF